MKKKRQKDTRDSRGDNRDSAVVKDGGPSANTPAVKDDIGSAVKDAIAQTVEPPNISSYPGPDQADRSVSGDRCEDESARDTGRGMGGFWIGFGLIAILFTASGFSSLIYQVVWTRMLNLVFGSTTFATSTVLAVFMGGLALGSYLAAQVSDKVKRPFLWYGILEGVIGLWAVLVPLLFSAAVPLYRAIWQQFHLSVLPFSILRFVVTALILIVPTACMGATLPLLSRFVTTSLDFVGRRVGTLYALNTLGAVFGAVVAGFLLLPACGILTTTLISALINIALFLIVAMVSPRLEGGRERPQSSLQTTGPLPAKVKYIMLCFAISGALAMVYEVGWTRTLLMVIGSSTYAFTVMLSTFLLGIFLGSLICARYVDRAREPVLWFSFLQVVLCLTSFAAMVQFNYLPYWNLHINAVNVENANFALFVRFLLAASTLLPLTLCLGAIFPVVVKACALDLAAIGRSAGSLYSANTLGAIVGATLAGFALIPALGVEKTLSVAALANLALGVAVLMVANPVAPAVKVSLAAICLVVIVGNPAVPKIWDPLIVISGQSARRTLSRENRVPSSYDQFKGSLHERSNLVFYEDGASSTVGVLRFKSGPHYSLVTNGHVDASDHGDMDTQVLVSSIAMLFKPDSKKVAVVGWGSGVTIGTLSRFPLESITAIELEPSVIAASRFFHHVNHSPESSKKVSIEINDGRNYLLATAQKFDLIISEPSNPWQAGVCNLFTREYFRICRNRLTEDGMFALWLQTVEVPPQSIRGILSAVRSVYPHALALISNSGNLVILCANKPIVAKFDRMKELLNIKAVAADLREVRVTSVEDVLARIQCTERGIRRIAGRKRPNTDDFNELEFTVGKTYETKLYSLENRELLDLADIEPWDHVDWSGFSLDEKAREMAKIARRAVYRDRPDLAFQWAEGSLKVKPNGEAYAVIGVAKGLANDFAGAEKAWTQSLALQPDSAEVLVSRGYARFKQGDIAAARSDFLRAMSVDKSDKEARLRMAQTYLGDGKVTPVDSPLSDEARVAQGQQALSYLGDLPSDQAFIKHDDEVLLCAGKAALMIGRLQQAEKWLRQYMELEPGSVEGSRLLATVLYARNARNEGSGWMYYSLTYGQDPSDSATRQARKLIREGGETAALQKLLEAQSSFPGNKDSFTALRDLSKRRRDASRIFSQFRMMDSLMPPAEERQVAQPAKK